MRNIIFIGLPGSGKTTLGRMAANELNLPFIDLDEEIERQAGMTIQQIFDLHGESFFRDLETRVAREETARGGAVISTGGGVVLREENLRALHKNGLVIFLDRPVEAIARDIQCEARPLLSGGTGRLNALSKERRPIYLAAADIVLQNNSGLPEALNELLAVIQPAMEKSD